jgi:hypothetical protein
MFDSSYSRSRVYFKTLEILRIFSDEIRPTGRQIRGWASRGFVDELVARDDGIFPGILREDPDEDAALSDNWRVLLQFYDEAEKRLLSKIAEKTREITSLRDGVSRSSDQDTTTRLTVMTIARSCSTQPRYARYLDQPP